ncbi:MAG: cell division protein FtsZ [Alphaproteobacteria bacterium]
MTINLSMPATHQLKPRITVIGVGGAGGNAVNNMITSHLEGVDFVVANTDAQALAQSLSERRIQLGVNITQGLGAGSRPDVGRAAAEEAMDEIVDHLQGSNMVFITAGMGGGTGTGGGPVVAKTAREQGILTVGVVTKPFNFEGVHRMRLAEEGLVELQNYVDTLIIIPNQNLFRVANEKTTFADAFKMADDVLYSGVRGVTDLMVMPGLINLDFADVRSVMAEMGKAMMGTGEAEGERRSIDAAEAAISNPLLDDVSMKGAKGVLINITGGYDMTLFEVDEAANRIREEVDPAANIIFGSTFDEALAGRMRISVVATGIEADAATQPQPMFGAGIAAQTPVRLVPKTPAMPEIEPPVAAECGPISAGAELEADEPAAAVAADDSFIPPPPVEPGRRAPLGPRAEPFAAAAMANGTLAPTRSEPRRTPTLFERVTSSVRARQPRTTPSAPARRTPAAEPVLETAGGPPEPSVSESLTLPRVEEDLLDIPAFLRRQSN